MAESVRELSGTGGTVGTTFRGRVSSRAQNLRVRVVNALTLFRFFTIIADGYESSLSQLVFTLKRVRNLEIKIERQRLHNHCR